MSIDTSIAKASSIARAFSERNNVISVKHPNMPLGLVASSLSNYTKPNHVGFCPAVAMESEETILRANEIIAGAQAETIDSQVDNITTAMNATLFTARNVISPLIKIYTEEFIARQALANQPNIAVNVFKYHNVHSNAVLVNHVYGNYREVQNFGEYRTFILEGKQSVEELVTFIAENCKLVEQSDAVEWMLELGAARIGVVWTSLFGSARVFDLRTSYTRETNWPLEIDDLLLAYLMTEAMLENPQDVVGESIQLHEWEKVMGILHEYLGHRLYKAYEYRSQDAKMGRLIIASDAADAMRTGVVNVLVNDDVYQNWIQNNDVQAILGAAVYMPNLKTAPQIAAHAEELVKKWMEFYPVMRNAVADRAIAGRKSCIKSIFTDTSIALPEGTPVIDENTFYTRIDNELRALKPDAFDNAYLLFTRLVCLVYYPHQPMYLEFLESMVHYNRIFPEATPRELAIEAMIEVMATWLSAQMSLTTFTPQVDPNAVLTMEDVNVKIDTENEDIAEDTGVIEEEPEINEVEEQEEAEDNAEVTEDPTVSEDTSPELDPETDPVDTDDESEVEGEVEDDPEVELEQPEEDN